MTVNRVMNQSAVACLSIGVLRHYFILWGEGKGKGEGGFGVWFKLAGCGH